MELRRKLPESLRPHIDTNSQLRVCPMTEDGLRGCVESEEPEQASLGSLTSNCETATTRSECSLLTHNLGVQR